jgi:hypothetical protein
MRKILAPLMMLLAPCAAEPLEAQEPVATRRSRPTSKPWIATPTLADTSASEPLLVGGGPTNLSKPWGAGGDRPRETPRKPVAAGGGPTYTSKPWVAR